MNNKNTTFFLLTKEPLSLNTIISLYMLDGFTCLSFFFLDELVSLHCVPTLAPSYDFSFFFSSFEGGERKRLWTSNKMKSSACFGNMRPPPHKGVDPTIPSPYRNFQAITYFIPGKKILRATVPNLVDKKVTI